MIGVQLVLWSGFEQISIPQKKHHQYSIFSIHTAKQSFFGNILW